ncbi:MAG: DUF4143 domain-containing protein [Methanomassiliicoccaceae archaeon]|nr:DUF4143 domain-containing protein [Methanomassiliicoccaceae archaeon]
MNVVKRKYLDRIVDRELDRALESSGAVLIKGPKWCGKTRTAEERAASKILMQDPNNTEHYKMIADSAPSLLLEGDVPRLIDEWQIAPVLWNGVRFEVDQRGENGQFILTGSVTPKNDPTLHTGTGRITRLFMRTMTLFESLESSGEVSLRTLFNGEADIKGRSPLTIDGLAFALARGGWPRSVGEKESIALRRAYDYVDSLAETEISSSDGVERNPARIRNLMRSLARNVSTAAKLTTIREDMEGDDIISDKTVTSYINALRRMSVVEDLPAWCPAVRSKTAIRTSPKRHFVDPSIAVAVLRMSPEGLLKDFKTFGLLFESLCVRDLRVYAQAMDGEVFHYRDRSGLEADAIVHLKDGRWGAVEIKTGAKETEKAAENLIKLKDRIDTERMTPPSFLMVLTASEYAYRRRDGVYVVPIGCLRD